jgi:hypothetical protein
MGVPGFPDMDTRTPRSGETVSLLGFGIAAQDAVVEVTDASRLLLRIPQQDGLAVGTQLELQYLRDGALHSVRGKLESRTGAMWWLDVDRVEKVQRRQHVRVPVVHKATLLVPNPSGGEDAFLVDLVDVSAGGCAYLYDSSILEGNRVELRFRVTDGRVHVKAVVLECRPTPRGQYRVRCRFVDTAPADMTRITDWVIGKSRNP